MPPYSIVTALVILLTVHCTQSVDQPPRVTRPPTIMPERQIEDVIYFEPESSQPMELPCRALGSDPKTFKWTKNAKLLDLNDPMLISNTTNKPKIVRNDKNTGTITITELREYDEGVYQCIATNAYGISMSKKIKLVKATKRTFSDASKINRYKVIAANSLKMECNPPKNEPPGIIRWVQYYDRGIGKKTVEFNDRITMDKEGNLYFANVQKKDENDGEEYTCEIQIRELNMYIEGAFSYIEVDDGSPQAQFPVELAYHSESQVVGLKGESVAFQCIFTGNPTPSITWLRKSGGTLDKTRMVVRHQKLTIKDIKYEDAGTYECVGENPVMKDPIRHTFTLKVESKPEWVAEPQKVDAGVDESAGFECAADGKPAPNIQWYINGEPIGNIKMDGRMIFSEGQLKFNNLTREDAKVIQCNASNEHGHMWADVALSILAYQPELKASFKEIKVSEGKPVTLPCEIDGKPNPIIFWKRGAQKMEGPGYEMDPKGMTILNSTTDDAGVWTCFAENKYGKLNSSGELIVRLKTQIDLPPTPMTIKFGTNTTFRCAASTDPNEQKNLVITWLKDGKPVEYRKPRIVRSGNDLIIRGTTSEDTGNYTCVASNKLDSDSASAELKVIAPPDPPLDVAFSSCLSRSAVVTWTPGFDNYSPITRYYVEYNHSYAPNVWQRAGNPVDPSQTEVKVKISPYANYTFRVIAENNLGKSKPSDRSFAICDSNPDVPEKHPSNVHTDRSRPGWLIIKWDVMPEIEHNGPGFRYILNIKKDGVLNKTEISDWKENTKSFFLNQIYEPYEIFVEARNELGMFPEPALVHIGYTGEAEPLTSPTNFELVPGTNVTAKSATFQWDAVNMSPEMIRGEFQGYRIRYWKVGQRETTEQVVQIKRSPPRDTRIKRATKDQATVTSLPPYSDLEADIVASNTYFDSNASNVVNFSTPEGVPGRVRNARVILRGAHHFLVGWEAPEKPNGILIGYEIGYKKVNGFEVGEVTETVKFDDQYRSRAFIGDLDANQEYTIYIWAKTRKGLGDEYYFDAKTANTGPPITPSINIVMIGEDFVNVSWDVGMRSDSPAGSYHYVAYRKLGEIDWEKTEHETINTWVNVSNLEANTRYEMRVVASNGRTESPSEMEQVTTKGQPLPSLNSETSIAQASWFIVMMVAIAVLILFFIIVCFIKRSRGEKYNVQEREKLRGNDAENPDKDLFNEYPKSKETDPLAAGSPDSFDNDADKLPGGSETDSMAEYGDVDPSKFNEDGSFIGQYGNQKPDEKGNQPSAMSTFV